ncbi:hypothetical protein BX600DRAFT_28988 [Xylariales sp. PMI_506]|nr:hypothetical protein BX600DRAFT_28988 [Xylariales sp. PMI_506]
MSLFNGNASHTMAPERPSMVIGGGAKHLSQTLTSSNQNQRAPPPAFNDSSNDDSQDTSATHESDRIFTSPGSDSDGSAAALGNGTVSSQESQLFQLSQLAAAQEKMEEGAQSRKRMADGMVKHTRDSSSTSPVRKQYGHSRNTSAVSVASTAGSRIGELSAELKTKLSYAMIKVNNGWSAHSIDEVESLASQAASPTSSTSTVHGRNGASASPRVPLAGMRQGTVSAGISPVNQQPPRGRTYESFWRENDARPYPASASPPATQVPMLAPPAAIQPRQSAHTNSRRNSNAKHTPAFLSHSHHASPHTPAQPSPLQSTPGTRTLRTPQIDPILFSPHQNVREQEALETLVFMSSPGNSANLKHNFPASSSNPGGLSQSRNGLAGSNRTALPTSRLGPGVDQNIHARKTLPTARHHAHSSSLSKRVGFDKSPSNVSEMDIDDPYGSPHRGTPRRKTISGSRPSLTVPAALGGASRPRPTLQDEDIERMLDRAADDDSSDSDGEISLPHDRRRESARVGV